MQRPLAQMQVELPDRFPKAVEHASLVPGRDNIDVADLLRLDRIVGIFRYNP